MQPIRPSKTRTAPPSTPASWPSHPRMRVYSLFGWTGVVYLVTGLLILEIVWSLGKGPEAWEARMASLSNPAYLAFHTLALVSVLFVGVRFFRLFPKAQPAHIGPLKPPPRPVLHAMLYAAWAGVTVLLSAILAGVLF
jgi:fumarate reductase subunit C